MILSNFHKKAALAVFGAMCLMVSASAQEFPTKPIKIMVPYPAGGPFDVLARQVSINFQNEWKQPAVVENRPGANEIIAADALAKSPKDGYTMMVSTEAATVLNPLMYKKLPYNAATDLLPVVRLARAPLVLVMRSTFPAKNIQEFIAYAKQSPGKVNFGSGGLGNPTHLALALMEKKNGIQVTHVPYKGAAPLMQDILAGIMDASFFPVPIVEQYVKAGTIKAIAISGSDRASSLPDTPTFVQAGVPDVDASFYVQLVLPSQTPDAVVSKIALQTNNMVKDSEFRKKFMDPYGLIPVNETVAQFAQFRAKDNPIQAEKVKASGVNLEY